MQVLSMTTTKQEKLNVDLQESVVECCGQLKIWVQVEIFVTKGEICLSCQKGYLYMNVLKYWEVHYTI
jgi:hypothetical protein